jgi:rfaE bifunctional protein kinase chain/domain
MPFPLTQVLQQISGTRVLVVGDVMADEYVVGDASRISAEAPVPVLRFSGERTALGGAGNTAANVASLGGAATLIGLIGDDAAGVAFAGHCTASGIAFSPVRDGRPTTRKVRVISQQQQLLRIDYEDTTPIDDARARQVLDVFERHVASCEIVVVSDYAKGLLTRGLSHALIAGAHAAGKQVVVDPRPQHAAFYAACDFITPNWKESLGLLNEGVAERDSEPTPEKVRRVGAAVSQQFGSAVLLTLGARGIAFFPREGGEPLIVAAEAREVFDVSGAGDTVAAAFALAHAAGCDHATAVALANRAAAVVVGKRGTATATPAELLAAAHPS